MELTNNERKIIEAKRAGANITADFHGVKSLDEAINISDVFKPSNVIMIKDESEGVAWIQSNRNEEYNLVVFYKKENINE